MAYPGRAGSRAACTTTRTTRWTSVRLGRLAERIAIRWEGEEGATRTLTYRELYAATNRLAHALRARGRGQRRPRGHLPADDPRDGYRGAGLCQARRDLHPHLLRLRRARGRLAAGRLRGQGADHRRRFLSPGQARADEGGRRRGRSPQPPACCTWWWCGAPATRRPGRRGATCGGTTSRRAQPEAFETERTSAEDPYMIIYTSGTTGRPKGASMSTPASRSRARRIWPTASTCRPTTRCSG